MSLCSCLCNGDGRSTLHHRRSSCCPRAQLDGPPMLGDLQCFWPQVSAAAGLSKASLARLAGDISSSRSSIVVGRVPVPMSDRARRPRDALSCLFNRSTGSHPCSHLAPCPAADVETVWPPLLNPCRRCDPPTCCRAQWGPCWAVPFRRERRAEWPPPFTSTNKRAAPYPCPPAPPVRAHSERHRPLSIGGRTRMQALWAGKWANIPKWVK